MPLNSCTINLQTHANQTAPIGGGTSSLNTPDSASRTYTFTNGNGTMQAEVIASLSGTVTHGTPVTIDLRNLINASLQSPLTLTSVREISVQDTTPTPVPGNNLQMGDSTGAIANEWTAPWLTAGGGDKVDAGGMIVKVAPLGYAIDPTHKLLTLNSSNGTVNWQIDLVGTVT